MASDKLNPQEKELVKAVLAADYKRTQSTPPPEYATAVELHRERIKKLMKKLGERYFY
jgi:hypothetical protein